MGKTATLRARLTVGVTLLCLSVLTLAGIATYFGARTALQRNLDNALLSIARAEIASAVDEPGGKVHVHSEPEGALHLPSGSGYEKFAQIESADDRIVARTGNLAREPLRGEPTKEQRARAGVASFGDLRRNGEDLRVLYYPLKDAHGHSLITVCAISKSRMQESLASLRNTLLLMVGASAVLAAWGTHRLVGKLLAPLERMAREAHTIDAGNLNARLSVPARDAELQELAVILNAMLARLDTAFATQTRLMDAQHRFLVDASHELRSPLANLRGTLEVTLRRPRESGQYQEALVAALSEAERLSRLVNDLTTLARAESGQFSLDFAPCDLARIAADAVTAHQARAETEQVRLQIQGDGQLPVNGDAHRLRQVVDNLLDNALRYAPVGSVVDVVTRREGDRAALSVRDAGPGLTDEEQGRVFDRFYRADESRARSTGGMGLGLTIARAFAEAHQGELSVRSAPGQGCTFTLSLGLGEEGVQQ